MHSHEIDQARIMNESVVAPNFFVVGAAKSGTTSMFEYLREHPEIFMPTRKWLNYFNKDLVAPGNCPSMPVFLSKFADASNEKMIGEASEAYLYSKAAASEISTEYPAARIIIMLRNPADMLYSLHNELVLRHVEDIKDFSEALDTEEDRKKGNRIPVSKVHPTEWLFYRETVRYAEQVERYFQAFGRDGVHIIIFDDFMKNTEKEYADTLRFLGVDENFCPNFKVHNSSKGFRSFGLQRFIRSPSEPLRRIVRAAIPSQALRTKVARRLYASNVKEQKRASLSPELRQRLIDELTPEVEKLESLLGFDLRDWKKCG